MRYRLEILGAGVKRRPAVPYRARCEGAPFVMVAEVEIGGSPMLGATGWNDDGKTTWVDLVVRGPLYVQFIRACR